MNHTFSRVSAFCGLRLSYYTTAALLAVAFLVLAMSEYRTPSPLYILLTLAVLPSLLKAMLFSSPKAKERESDLAFPLFCKKYKYEVIQYKSMNAAYLLLFLLLAAWQISYSPAKGAPDPVAFLPSFIAALSLLVRCCRLPAVFPSVSIKSYALTLSKKVTKRSVGIGFA